MTENNSPSVRYMDFVGRRRAASTDPLVGRPRTVAKVQKSETTVAKVRSAGTPSVRSAGTVTAKPMVRTPVRPVSSARAVTVKKSSERELVARKPSTEAKELFPTRIEKTEKPVVAKKAEVPARKAGGNLPEKSPFLKDYSIDKRPLSSSVPEKKREGDFEKLSFLGVSEKKGGSSLEAERSGEPSEAKDTKKSERGRKNMYEKRKAEKKKPARESESIRIIDDSNEKKGLPLFVVIIITVLLGAAVGAGVYFLMPK